MARQARAVVVGVVDVIDVFDDACVGGTDRLPWALRASRVAVAEGDLFLFLAGGGPGRGGGGNEHKKRARKTKKEAAASEKGAASRAFGTRKER